MATRKCKYCIMAFDASKALCPHCKQWNSGDMPDNNASVAKALDGADADNTILLSNVKGGNTVRIQTGPWDPCFGMHYTRERRIGRNGHFIDDGGPVYGLVKTSTTLIGGEPGAGKTTMALQICDGIANTTQREIIYVGAEQAAKEIRDTFDRLRLKNHHLMRIVPLGSDANIAQILLTRRPCAAVFDSLPGLGLDAEEGVSFCKALKGYAVELEAPILVIDHVTKADNFAGLKALQHEVDTLVTLRGEKDEPRELASTKNRHGACVEMTLIMTEWGLRAATKEELEEEEEDEDE